MSLLREARTVVDLLDSAAANTPEKVALTESSRRWTYEELQGSVNRLANNLARHGVRRGDRVALLFPNSSAFVVSFLAILRLGAAAMPLYSRLEPGEIANSMLRGQTSTLIAAPESGGFVSRIEEEIGDQCKIVLPDPGELWSTRSRGSENPFPSLCHPDDVALYQFSSGSTGQPKCVARTHRNLLCELRGQAGAMRLKSNDRFLGVAPFSHLTGLGGSLLASLSLGATLIPLPEFERREVIREIGRRRITVFVGVPFMFSVLAQTRLPAPLDCDSLRLCVSASGPMSVSMNRKFRERFGQYVRQRYGTTETGMISVNMSPCIDSSLESAGLPIEEVAVVVFRKNGSRAGVEETGEIAVRSPAAIQGYCPPSEGSEAFRSGYFFTGDLGRIDGRGYLYLVGRKTHFINKAGLKINPKEVESILRRHELVSDVAVTGVPTRAGDEAVKAVVVVRRPCSEQDLLAFCSGKIASFKIPSVFEFRDTLPKTETGKIIRYKL